MSKSEGCYLQASDNCNFKLSTCFRISSTKCRINTVVSPDDGHIVAQNMYRKEINILRTLVQQVGFIYKIIQGGRSTKHKIQYPLFHRIHINPKSNSALLSCDSLNVIANYELDVQVTMHRDKFLQ